MDQKKSIIISCLLCALTIIVSVGILLIRNRGAMPASTPAVSCAQLEISVDFPAGKQHISIWQNQEGIFYFFLPSGAEMYRIDFCNLGADTTLWLDYNIFTSKNPTINTIEYSKMYEMELNLSQENHDKDRGQVVFLKSDGLPSLFIDTVSGNMDMIHSDKEVKEEASVCLIDASGRSAYSATLEYIRSRGNSTFLAEKKPYQIKLKNDASLLDMPSAKKWLLLANAYDDTLIKNELVFRFTEKYTTVPSIQGKYVDLYLNGEYVGNYYLCEKIEIGENRLNISDLETGTEQVNSRKAYETAEPYVSGDGRIKATSGLENPVDITGGYLLEHIDWNDYEQTENAFMTDGGHCYAIKSPNPATVEQAQYIHDLFNEMELAIAQEDGIHPETGKHFSEYLDIDSWTSKYLVEELFHDPEAIARSMFFYKDSDKVDPHIFSGPMWDYDGALGGGGIATMALFSVYDPYQVGNLGVYAQQLMQHQDVRQQVYDKFEQYALPYVEYLASADIYNLSQEVQPSAEMNRIRWPIMSGYYSDAAAERDRLLHFLQQKTDFLRECWLEDNDYCAVTFLDYYGNVYARYNIKRGEYLNTAPTISSFTDIFSGWYTADGDIIFDSRLPILQDITYESRWIPMDILLTNGLNISGMDVSQIDAEALQSMVDLIQELQKEATATELESDMEDGS